MATTERQPTRAAEPDPLRQYSLGKILGIWAAATAPMGALAWIVGPAIIPHTSLYPGLVHWLLLVAGMIWQFLLSLIVLRHESGRLRWSAMKKRLRLNLPRDPKTGRPRRRLLLWVLPAILANYLGGLLAAGLDTAWSGLIPVLGEPWYARLEGLADPQFQGQWWILGLATTSVLFNYLLGEELLFRGVLLPRMAGVFGRWDWVANTVLFGLYHVHKIWVWPSMITSSFGMAWATGRYRSYWMGVIVHGIEGFFLFLIVGVVLGWYP